jgi:phospholipase/carboxylesterase
MNMPLPISELQQEPQSGLLYRRVIGSGTPHARLLLLHGVGGNESNLAGIASFIPEGIEVLLVRSRLQIAAEGFAWFQVNFTNEGPVIVEEQAESSRQKLIEFVTALPHMPTVIAGFSQGGILSASVGLSAPHCVAGFGLLSGRILPELAPHIASTQALSSLSAFVAHGHADNKLPVSWAQKADAWLSQLNVRHETHLYNMGHEITAEEIEDFVQWLKPLLHIE